jgi:electron transport complex protein RnfG
MKKDMTKLGVTLMLFASLACASLAVVYAFTKESIDKQSEMQLQASLKELFPQATAFDPIQDLVSPNPNFRFEAAYEVKSDMAPLGLAVKATGPSYGGNATLLVGIDLHRSVAGVRVMTLNDTPGLGMNASNPTYYVDKTKKMTFLGQFAGKFLTDPFEVKKDVVAITAATISSRSLTNIIKAAGNAAIAYMDQKAIAAPAEGDASAGDGAEANTQPQAGGK